MLVLKKHIVVTAGAKTMGGLLVVATANLKDRFMANYSPPSRKKNDALSNDKLARAVAALGQALKDSKNRAE